MPKEKLRVTDAQNDVLCRFFEEHPEVIRGYKKSPRYIEAVQTKWKKITPHLNSLGPPKDHKSWAKYLCNMKAKLKQKPIKWSKTNDGTGSIICNAEDFNEIKLRMLQVLQVSLSSQDTQKPNTSDTSLNQEETKIEQNDEDSFEDPYPWHEADDSNKTVQSQSYIKLRRSQSPTSTTPQVVSSHNEWSDEFDTFGKNIAQQLRTLPLPLALHTQEMLLAVIRKQRLRMLNNTQNSVDPLDK
ncbi:uncharacterized protein LOC131851864 [Achroia grisella]|uniref:uncharacterized protein LOC131851864 n=1 Tax=Achroia grisella TaxID=688607 RepID=UPI0027D28492|nr:uncharacterized protein LOC131851864 [Achroia grisella]